MIAANSAVSPAATAPPGQPGLAAPSWTVLDVVRSRVGASLLVAAFVVRLVYGAWAILPYNDGRMYDELAHNLLAGEYRSDGDGGLPRRAPGYSLFLAMVYSIAGESHVAARVAQALLDLVTALLVLSIVRHLRMRWRIGVLAMGISLFNPFTMVYSAMILSETLAGALVTAALWALIAALRTRRGALMFAFGAACSATALVRPSFALMPAVLLLAVLVGRLVPARRWVVWSTLAVAGFAAVWLPWGIRNAVKVRAFIPYHKGEMHNPGYALWATTWAVHVMDIYAGFFEKPIQPPPKAFASEAERAELTALLAERGAASPPTPERKARLAAIDSRFHAIGADRIARHPIDFYLWKPLVRCFSMWFTSNSTFLAQANVPMSELWRGLRERPLAVAAKATGVLLSCAFPLLALLGWWLARREAGPLANLPVVVAAYSTLVIVLIMVLQPTFQVMMEPRYVIPSFPALTVLVAMAVGFLWSRLPWRRRATPAALPAR